MRTAFCVCLSNPNRAVPKAAENDALTSSRLQTQSLMKMAAKHAMMLWRLQFSSNREHTQVMTSTFVSGAEGQSTRSHGNILVT